MEEYTTEVLTTKNAIIRIHRPILTEEERAKRMKAIEKAAINLVLANRRHEALKKQQEVLEKPLASIADQSTMQRAFHPSKQEGMASL